MKQGDLLPAFTVTLLDGTSKQPVNLTGASSIKIIASQGGSVLFDRTVTGNSSGVISYAWQAGDTDTAGLIRIEIEVTWPGGKQTFPADGFAEVTIVEDLG